MLADFEAWQKAGSEEEREAIFARNDQRYNAMDKAQKEQFNKLCHEALDRVYDEVMEMRAEEETARLREKVETLSEALSLKYIAKKYFGKSSAWLYQRLNGNMVNGRKSFFSMKEIAQFKAALNDLSSKLSAAAA